MLLGLTNYADVTSLRTLKPVDEKLKKKKENLDRENKKSQEEPPSS